MFYRPSWDEMITFCNSKGSAINGQFLWPSLDGTKCVGAEACEGMNTSSLAKKDIRCDGVSDCRNSPDESQALCTDKFCKSYYNPDVIKCEGEPRCGYKCNGKEDCRNGTDESPEFCLEKFCHKRNLWDTKSGCVEQPRKYCR